MPSEEEELFEREREREREREKEREREREGGREKEQSPGCESSSRQPRFANMSAGTWSLDEVKALLEFVF